MVEKFILAATHWLLVTAKVAMYPLILVAACVFAVKASSSIWQSLSATIHEPKVEDFCGRYFPMEGTASFLNKKYPSTQTWLEFKRDGRFVINDSPFGSRSGNDESIKMEYGKWEFKSGPGRVMLMGYNPQGEFTANFKLIGQKPPYIVERWNDSFPMQFCTNPQQSPAVRAYTQVSITDLVLQAVVLLSIFVLPFILRPGAGGRAFGYPFMIAFFWGAWRMAFYDPITHNDIVGVVYLLNPFFYALIARVIFAVRCSFRLQKVRLSTGKSNPF